MADTREKLEVIAHLSDHITYKEGIGICYDSALAKVIEDAYMTLKNGVTVQKWIPVSEPPKKDGRYLVAKKIFNKIVWQEVLSFAKDGRKVDKYDFHRGWKNVWYRYDGEWGYLTIDNVTHWMPLPEPPTTNEVASDIMMQAQED